MADERCVRVVGWDKDVGRVAAEVRGQLSGLSGGEVGEDSGALVSFCEVMDSKEGAVGWTEAPVGRGSAEVPRIGGCRKIVISFDVIVAEVAGIAEVSRETAQMRRKGDVGAMMMSAKGDRPTSGDDGGAAWGTDR